MRSRAATIFVEGDSDLRFIQQYLKHCSAFEKVEGIPISKLHGNTTALSSDGGKLLIKEALTNSAKTLVLLDANSNPDKTRERFDSWVKDLAKNKTLDTKSIHLFLVPDDENKGALEDLLLRIARDSDAVGKCFEAHRQCLRDSAKICESRLPGAKQKFYVYCDTVLGTTPQKCDFSDSHWDLNSYLLNPLRDFLAKHLLQSP